jgi:hypothetical protein
MDPLTTLSLAGNIIQVIQFGSQVVSKGYRLHKSSAGALCENIDLEAAACTLRRLTVKLQNSLSTGEERPLTEESQVLHDICNDCIRVADQLLAKLDALKIPENNRQGWKSLRQGLKSVLGKNGVDEIASSLSLYRNQLEIHILASLR